MERVIYQAFEAGRHSDFTTLANLHLRDPRFSKFDDSPPLHRLSYEEAAMYEQLAFAGIADYTFKITELRIDLFDTVAVATFILEYGGLFVNNYTFEGKTLRIRSRATMVLVKQESRWLLAHEHFSRLPEPNPKA